jgi:hypothetical protein
MTGTQYHPQLLFIEMGVSLTFFPVWPQTIIFLISPFQVARITAVSHQLLAVLSFLIKETQTFEIRNMNS